MQQPANYECASEYGRQAYVDEITTTMIDFYEWSAGI